MGLEERRSVPTKSWKTSRHAYDPAPDLTDALAAAASRLGLAQATA
jgi:hypothetical protein